MPLPYPQNLTPDSPPYSTVQINEYWWSVIFGFGDSALVRENWDVTDEEWENDVHPAVINALDTAMNCDCIKGLSYDPVTGKLTYTDESGGTVTVINSSETFLGDTYYVITQNEPNADDAYCYAAHMLSERTSDSLQDMLETLDIIEDATIGSVTQYFASFVDLVPFFGDFAEANIRIIDQLAEEMWDWITANARDVQARALAAEIMYCGIKIAMQSGGQTSIRAGIKTAAADNLIEFSHSFVDGLWQIPDVFAVFEDAFDALDGELMGYGIIAWFLITDEIFEKLGADRPLEALMAKATRYAAAHDSRDCASFECNVWIAEFDFTIDEQGWSALEAAGFRAVYSAGNGWEKGTAIEDPPGIQPYCQLKWGTHDAFGLVKAEYFLTNNQAEVAFQMQFTVADNETVNLINADYAEVEKEQAIPANDIFLFGIDVENVDFAGYFHKLRIFGTGTIPSQWATYEVDL